MNREEVFEYVKSEYKTVPKYLWSNNPFYAVLRHKNKKWYAIIMNVPKAKLGLDGNEDVDIINIKCPPELVGSLRLSKGFLPAYHMNKEHWITILLEEWIDADKIKYLIDLSYELTKK
jgi:predicted DNA-binding protein (MmcQ/YjbR family)